MVYENEEFNPPACVLNIEEEGYEGLRYNNIVIATGCRRGWHAHPPVADDLLYRQFFPELVKNGHVYILKRLCSGCVTTGNDRILQ